MSWAGCFAAGGPRAENLTKLWKTMPIGSTYALLIVLVVQATSGRLSFWGAQADTMATIFLLNTALMYTGRIKAVGFVPGMFFGFSSFFATYFGGWGPIAHNPFTAWIAVIIMNAIGPAYAYLNVKLALPVPNRPRGKGVVTAPAEP